jgi:hypothetical protein
MGIETTVYPLGVSSLGPDLSAQEREKLERKERAAQYKTYQLDVLQARIKDAVELFEQVIHQRENTFIVKDETLKKIKKFVKEEKELEAHRRRMLKAGEE